MATRDVTGLVSKNANQLANIIAFGNQTCIDKERVFKTRCRIYFRAVKYENLELMGIKSRDLEQWRHKVFERLLDLRISEKNVLRNMTCRLEGCYTPEDQQA